MMNIMHFISINCQTAYLSPFLVEKSERLFSQSYAGRSCGSETSCRLTIDISPLGSSLLVTPRRSQNRYLLLKVCSAQRREEKRRGQDSSSNLAFHFATTTSLSIDSKEVSTLVVNGVPPSDPSIEDMSKCPEPTRSDLSILSGIDLLSSS